MGLYSSFTCLTTMLQGVGPYAGEIKKLEADIVEELKKVNELIGA